MKNKDITKNYRTGFLLNLVVSAFIVCVAESLLLFNYGRLMLILTGTDPQGSCDTFTAEQVLIFVLTGVLLFGVLFWLLERKRISYIRTISRGISRIAGGELGCRLEVRGDDEFSEMAESVNQMASDLQQLLALEREEEKTRTELITNIAHDLRTPLTSVIGYLELLSGKSYEALSEEQKRKYLKIACSKAKRLEQLIGDLFDYTKLSCGRITLNVGYVDLVKLLEQILEETWPAFRQADLRYEFRTNVSSLEIAADAGLLARLFENLIGNAVKYGADGKKVLIRLHADEEADTAEVQVINFGFVIDEKDIPHIFDKFYRADKARSTGTGGSGLGLAIARNIVDLHGGSIFVRSDLNGTVFTVRLRIHFNREKEALQRA